MSCTLARKPEIVFVYVRCEVRSCGAVKIAGCGVAVNTGE